MPKNLQKIFIIFTILIQSVILLDITCEFSISNIFQDFELYTCTISNLNITFKGTQITNVLGTHLDDLKNINVQKLSIKSSLVEHLPHGFDKFFKNIEILDVNEVGLLELNHKDMKQFMNLKYLQAAGNKLVELEDGIFDDNLKIQSINFKNNQLRYIDYRIFDKILTRNSEEFEFESNLVNNVCIKEFKTFKKSAQVIHRIKNCIHENEVLCKYSDYTDCAVRDAMEFLMIEKTKIIGELIGDGHDDSNITKVSILSSNFTKIPEIFGTKFKNLENFSLRGKIRFLNFEDFKSYEKLKKLNLEKNLIIYLESDAFILTPNLEVIDLSSNNIVGIGQITFWILEKLEILSLKYNAIIDENFKSKSEIENSKELQKIFVNDSINCAYSTSKFLYAGLLYFCHVINPKSDGKKFPKKYFLEEFHGFYGQHAANKSHEDVEALIAKFTNSTALDPKVSYHFPNLKLIRITSSNLMYLHENNFDDLPNLQVVDFSDNKITEVPSGIFKNNQKLIFVDLTKNRIVEIYEIFGKFLNLEKFKMFENSNFNFEMSRKVPDFYGQPHISNTTLFDKTISKSYNIFGQPLIFENNLVLTNNSIGVSITCLVPDPNKNKNHSCKDENVQQITKILQLTSVTSKHDTKAITYLEIKSQIMYFLPTNFSNFFPNLKTLVASKGIKNIYRENFYGLSKLEGIYLALNEIEFIDDDEMFKDNPNLKFITIENNKLKKLSKHFFTNVVNLEMINIENNDCYFEGILTKEKITNSSRKISENQSVCGADLPEGFTFSDNNFDDLYLLNDY